MRISTRKKMSRITSMGRVGNLLQASSSQWKAIIGGVTTAVYTKKSAVMASQDKPKGDRGYMSCEAGISSHSGPIPQIRFFHVASFFSFGPEFFTTRLWLL